MFGYVLRTKQAQFPGIRRVSCHPPTNVVRMGTLPVHVSTVQRPFSKIARFVKVCLYTFTFINVYILIKEYWPPRPPPRLPPHHVDALAHCSALHLPAGPPPYFHDRSESDRFVRGTKPVLIKNAKIWTGRENGTDVVRGDVLLDNGIIQSVGFFSGRELTEGTVVVDAQGGWVTPGIVDVHSHLGDYASPALEGADDGNSPKGPVLPWLRSLDALNTHDDSYQLSIAGGVTTSLILPGSGNAIGGQAFAIKLRKTKERTPTSMLLEPPYTLNASFSTVVNHPRWRQMKHACGENPSGWYHQTRMDTNWQFREAYNKALKIKNSQDVYCGKALSGDWRGLGEFPHDLQWEALVDVLRGRVKVHTHCYEAVDLDDMVRLTNEFKFPIAAFHHASEAYLVPDLLKKAYGHTPGIALFATNARYKREAYRSSEFAPRILAQHGIDVMMKSDHSVLNSRHLLYEAQQAHYYGLAENLALASVTSTSAKVMGMDHRIGFVREGWDADLVIWDSHPLALGATPKQVFIDGIAQLSSPHVNAKPRNFQTLPDVPNFDREAEDAVMYEGLPSLAPKTRKEGPVMFTGVRDMLVRDREQVRKVYSASDAQGELGVVLVNNGRIVCAGQRLSCESSLSSFSSSQVEVEFVDLKNGTITPGLTSFGSPLGLEEINSEPSTNDGVVRDELIDGEAPRVFKGGIVKAVDGLSFGSRDAYLAYRAGVTSAVTAPAHYGFTSGLGTAFLTGAAHRLDRGAVVEEVTAFHVSVRHFGTPSVSTQIGTLRRMLLYPKGDAEEYWIEQVTSGEIPLVVEAHSADIIATLILLKREVESKLRRSRVQLTITGGAEAHLLAKELGEANVGVVLNPVRPFPYFWEDKRILPGPPLTKETAITKLMSHNVTVGVGIEEIWSARNTRFDIGWASLEAGGRISREQAFALGSTNLDKLLGVWSRPVEEEGYELVATEGGDLLEMGSKVVGVLSPSREVVDLF